MKRVLTQAQGRSLEIAVVRKDLMKKDACINSVDLIDGELKLRFYKT